MRGNQGGVVGTVARGAIGAAGQNMLGSQATGLAAAYRGHGLALARWRAPER